jgi:hypothetical protein
MRRAHEGTIYGVVPRNRERRPAPLPAPSRFDAMMGRTLSRNGNDAGYQSATVMNGEMERREEEIAKAKN